MDIKIINLTKELVDEKELLKVLEIALQKENVENALFNVIFVDNDYIHKINKTYRNIDRETDVISFALEDDNSIVNGSAKRILGDVYISLEKAYEQALLYKHSQAREIDFLAVHGLYHLLGYDHMTKEDEKVMFRKQKEVLVEYAKEKTL